MEKASCKEVDEMERVLSVIKDAGLTCLPCDKVNLDYERFMEYRDSDEHPAQMVFERPTPKERNKIKEIDSSTIFRYFLDGSRRTYKVADIILDGRYLPLIAGQVGVAVVMRDDNNRIVPLREFCKIEKVIAFPEMLVKDLPYLESVINTKSLAEFKLLRYKVKSEKDPIDLGVAQIMKRMQDLEVEAVSELSKNHLLQNDSMLIIDGPLRFKEMKDRPFDIVQFRNVIGLSKSFRPSFTVGKGKNKADVGLLTSSLDFGERSAVFKTTEDDKTIGMWYLRLRNPRLMNNPLQGIVKMECYAIDPEDKALGFDSDVVDVLSGHLLRERNVTPFKKDSRWASHIYPVYLAETYLKKSFMSDVGFQGLF